MAVKKRRPTGEKAAAPKDASPKEAPAKAVSAKSAMTSPSSESAPAPGSPSGERPLKKKRRPAAEGTAHARDAEAKPPRAERGREVRGYPAPYDGATPERPVSPYFADDSSITYEGSRIPWWVRVMWIGFWLLALYYAVVFAWPDAQRYF